MNARCTLVWPSREYLPGYVDALERGWSPDNVRGVAAAREELDQIAADADAFVASLVDREAKGAPIKLPDGGTVPRLPGYRQWLWDGEFCGSIGFRWQRGTEALPPHCLGHIGYAVVPWKQRRGYATAALRDMIRAAAAEGLRYVELVTEPHNVASQRVIESNGGVLVEHFSKPAPFGGVPALRYRIETASAWTCAMGSTRDVEVRRATAADVYAIADAHRDSIQSIGPSFYSLNDVAHWQENIAATLYLDAMEGGEVFFVAMATIDGVQIALGFSSDYPIEGVTHGTSVYVRGSAARRGIGTALLRMAEAHALENGSERIEIAASLAGANFYRANGYTEVRRGEARLTSGHHIACVFMRKDITSSGRDEPLRHL